MQITQEHASKVLEVVDAGLVSGVGQPIPGHMCVEAAVCYALGLPHGDNPESCVAQSLRRLKIGVNDAKWSSNRVRAKGLRKLSILQLGTANTLDEKQFIEKVILLIVNKYLPPLLRKVHLTKEADACKKATSLDGARAAAYAARAAAAAAYAARAARAADAAAAAAAAAAYAADVAADAAAAAAYATDAAAADDAAADDAAADDAAAAARAAAAYAAYAAAAAAAANDAAAADSLLADFCEDVSQILIEMNVPGTQWLRLL